jgi:hypothetical protein
MNEPLLGCKLKRYRAAFTLIQSYRCKSEYSIEEQDQ